MTKTARNNLCFGKFTIETLQHISQFCESVPAMVDYINNRSHEEYLSVITEYSEAASFGKPEANSMPDDTILIGDDGTLLNL